MVAEATDFYMGKKLKASLKGLSSLPKLADVKAKIASKGKLNPGGTLMASTVQEVEDFLGSSIYQKAAKKEAVLEAWLDGQTKAAKQKCRGLIYDISKTTFCVVVGQTWFSEFSSLDENTMNLDVDGQAIECKVEQEEVEIKI